MNHKLRVLFFSTGDATRSGMAEGFLRNFAGDEIIAASTAVQSTASDPVAQEVMKEVGVDISGQQPKAVAEFLKEHFAVVVTVCDASKERFPVWPFSRNIVRWNLADPEAAPAHQKRESFRQIRDEIRAKVQELMSHKLRDLRAIS